VVEQELRRRVRVDPKGWKEFMARRSLDVGEARQVRVRHSHRPTGPSGKAAEGTGVGGRLFKGLRRIYGSDTDLDLKNGLW
jgi:hypothetical protein